MASASSIKAGGAYVQLMATTDKLDAGLRAASARLKAFGASVAAMGQRMLMGGAALGAPLLLFARQASSAEAITSKFMSVFGDQGPAAKKWTEELADGIGRSRYALMTSMSAFQSVFRGLNFGQQESLELSQRLQQLAIDFGSLHNLADDEVMWRFRAAMSGSAEVLDQFGVNIRANALEQEFLRMGIRATAQTATEAQRTLARINIFQQSLQRSGGIGHAAANAGTSANQFRRLDAALRDTAITIGEALLPSLVKIAQHVAGAARAFSAWTKDNQQVITTVGGLVLGLTGLGAALFALGPAISFAGFALGTVSTALGVLKSLVGSWLTLGFVAGVGAILLYSEAGQAAAEKIKEGFWAIADTAKTTFGGISDAIAAGNWGLAAEIGWLGIRVAFAQGWAYLKAGGREFGEFFIGTYEDMTTGAARMFNDLVAGMSAGFHGGIKIIGDAWDHMVHGLMVAWNEIIRAIRVGWERVKAGATMNVVSPQPAIDRINQEVDADNRASGNMRDRNIAIREHDFARDQTGREQGFRAMDNDLITANQRQREQRARDRQAAFEEDMGPANALRDQLNALREQARREKDEANWAIALGGGPRSGISALSNAPGAVGAMANKLEAKGTFSADAVAGMGASTLADHGKKIDKSNDLLKTIAANTKDNMPKFG